MPTLFAQIPAFEMRSIPAIRYAVAEGDTAGPLGFDLGEFQLGGDKVPRAIAWPRGQHGEPMLLLGAMRLTAAASLVAHAGLARPGFLYFFIDLSEPSIWPGEGKQSVQWCATQDDMQEAPGGAAILPEHTLAGNLMAEPPCIYGFDFWPDGPSQMRVMSEHQGIRQSDLYGPSGLENGHLRAPGLQTGGYPYGDQDDPFHTFLNDRYGVTLRTNRGAEAAGGAKDWDPDETLQAETAERGRPRLLLQVPRLPAFGIEHGIGPRLFFVMHERDLAEGRFERVSAWFG